MVWQSLWREKDLLSWRTASLSFLLLWFFPNNFLWCSKSEGVLDYRFLRPYYISIILYCFVPIRKDARLLVYKFSSLVFRRLNHSLLSWLRLSCLLACTIVQQPEQFSRRRHSRDKCWTRTESRVKWLDQEALGIYPYFHGDGTGYEGQGRENKGWAGEWDQAAAAVQFL